MKGIREIALPPSQQLKRSPSTMKKFVPSVSNLFDHCGSRHLSQLLALFVAIALTPSMLLGEDEDHLNGRDKVHDPTGVWILRLPQDLLKREFILIVFHRGGTFTGDFQGESGFDPASVPLTPKSENTVITTPESGVWQKTGWSLCGNGSGYGILQFIQFRIESLPRCISVRIRKNSVYRKIKSVWRCDDI
jgi:hypothetical protein